MAFLSILALERMYLFLLRYVPNNLFLVYILLFFVSVFLSFSLHIKFDKSFFVVAESLSRRISGSGLSLVSGPGPRATRPGSLAHRTRITYFFSSSFLLSILVTLNLAARERQRKIDAERTQRQSDQSIALLLLR